MSGRTARPVYPLTSKVPLIVVVASASIEPPLIDSVLSNIFSVWPEITASAPECFLPITLFLAAAIGDRRTKAGPVMPPMSRLQSGMSKPYPLRA